MHELAREVLAIAEAGLKRARAPARAVWCPTRRISSTRSRKAWKRGKVPADELLEHYQTDWAGDLTRIYGEYSY
jgi:glutamate--cysteine ligase